MKKYFFIVIILVFSVLSSPIASCTELSDGDLVPVTGEGGIAAGNLAPALDLYNLNGDLKHIVFNNSPTIIVSLYTLNGVSNKIEQLVNLYKDQNYIKLLFIVRDEPEYVKVWLMKHECNIPVYFERGKEFSTKYNIGVPAMVIIDEHGIVRYNNMLWVDLDSVDSFMQKLLLGKEKTEPHLLYSAPKKNKKEVPDLLDIGAKVPNDVFRDLEGNALRLDYVGKTTAIFYWMGFTNDKFLDEMMPFMQKIYEEKGEKVNVYTINGSGSRRLTMNTLDRYYTSFPTLLGGEFLQYSRSFPSFIVIDGNGILRYRTSSFQNLDELDSNLTQIIEEND